MGSRLDLFLLTIAILLGTVLSDLILSKVDRRVSLSLSLSLGSAHFLHLRLNFMCLMSDSLISSNNFAWFSFESQVDLRSQIVRVTSTLKVRNLSLINDLLQFLLCRTSYNPEENPFFVIQSAHG